MNNIQQPLDRLNYYNGQRLEAVDFRLEQDYHMRVRRWLNKSLYTAGIAAGLEVTVKEGDPHKVMVSPGMALDAKGREIILLEARELQVVGKPSTTPGIVFGNYLVIQYAEETVVHLKDGCCLGQSKIEDQSGTKLGWGGPARIRAEPIIQWRNTWPPESSGQVVLAQVELDQSCAVRDIRTVVRKYVGAAQPAKVRAVTLEGEKDIDKDNPKEFFFHIEGGFPNAVWLYLKGGLFSTLYYTEMGSHTHEVTVHVENVSTDFSHHHSLSEGETEPAGEHGHTIRVDDYGEDWPGVDSDSGNNEDTRQILPGGEHHHSFSGLSTDPAGGAWSHNHSATASATVEGTPDVNVRSGNSRAYVNELQIAFDGNDVTPLVLAQLQDRDGLGTWQQLGDGTANHDLVTLGTQAIDLIRLGVDLSPGQHLIKLSVPSGGGKIHYNLYVE